MTEHSPHTRAARMAGALPGIRIPLALLASLGCADFSPELVPTELSIEPANSMIQAGSPSLLSVRVTDQNGNTLPRPAWGIPRWSTSDKSVAVIAPDGAIQTGIGGEIEVAAEIAGLRATTMLRVNPVEVKLSSPAVYLTQLAQNAKGSVPLIAGRSALARIFITGHETSFYPTGARLSLYFEGEKVFEAAEKMLADRIPTDLMENRLGWSVNVNVPGRWIQPGVSMVVEVDPDGTVPKASGSQTRIPETGSTPLDVVEPPVFRQSFVPTILDLAPDGEILDWVEELTPDSEELAFARRVLPLDSMEIGVREPLSTWDDLTQDGGWFSWISAVELLQLLGGNDSYYYGVAALPPDASRKSLAVVGLPVAVGGRDPLGYAAAMGHNFSLRRAPCAPLPPGQQPATDYPYEQGSIGIWGYDAERGKLLDPSEYFDLMTPCSPVWISDFHFAKAVRHRISGDGGIVPPFGSEQSAAAPNAGDHAPRLLLRGRIIDGQPTLDPAFVLESPPLAPDGGRYSVEGVSASGETLFSHAFEPNLIDARGSTFLLSVPYEDAWRETLAEIVLTGPEGSSVVRPGSSPPSVIVRDPATGAIRAIIGEWDGSLLPREAESEILISNGLPGSPR